MTQQLKNTVVKKQKYGANMKAGKKKFFPNLEIKDTGDRLMATKKKNEATNQYVLTLSH